jgi:hypothetical protein
MGLLAKVGLPVGVISWSVRGILLPAVWSFSPAGDDGEALDEDNELEADGAGDEANFLEQLSSLFPRGSTPEVVSGGFTPEVVSGGFTQEVVPVSRGSTPEVAPSTACAGFFFCTSECDLFFSITGSLSSSALASRLVSMGPCFDISLGLSGSGAGSAAAAAS